jgi:hypothetical protein
MDTATMQKCMDAAYISCAMRINSRYGACQDQYCFVDLLLAHSTSVLQAMDVGSNDDLWHVANHKNNVKPHQRNVSQWITRLWSNIKDTTVEKMWKHIKWELVILAIVQNIRSNYLFGTDSYFIQYEPSVINDDSNNGNDTNDDHNDDSNNDNSIDNNDNEDGDNVYDDDDPHNLDN